MFTGLVTALLLAAKLEFVVPDANISLREGLPAVQVLSLYQDDEGAVWAGTTGGLAQLGGPEIKIYGPERGLSRSSIFAIAQERSGALIVATDGGILRLAGDHFEPVVLPAAAAQQVVKRFVQGRDGNLWALAGDHTLLRHDGTQWQMVGIDGALAFEANDFAVDGTGVVWIATRTHGLLRFSPVGNRLEKTGQFRADGSVTDSIDHVSTAVTKVYFTSARGLSMISATSPDGVETAPFPSGASMGHRSIAMTSAGRVFVGTNAGVFSLEARSLIPVDSRNNRARASVGTLLSDHEGQLWVGTIETGLNLLLMGRGVRFLRADGESFRTIDIDKTGLHWVSNDRRILYFTVDGRGTPVTVGEANVEGFDVQTINGVDEDDDGNLLFALDGGVGRLSAGSQGSGPKRIQHDPRFEALRERLVTSVRRDKSGGLWAASPLGLFHLPKGAAESVNVALPGGDPWATALDQQGGLWVATRQGALNHVDPTTAAVVVATLPAGRRVEFLAGAPDEGVVTTFDNGDSAMFSTLGNAGGAISAKPLPGFSWLAVQSLQRMGQTYLAGHGGDRLSRIRLGEGQLQETILTSADLEDSDFRYLSLREGRAGQVWFALPNGIGLLDPDSAPPPPNRLRLEPALASFVINARPNTLDLHAQISDPIAPRKGRYRFRLQGQTDEWSAWSNDSHIPLSNLAPGTYRLEVEGEDRFGRKAAPLTVEVVARSHPWESWAARLGGLLVVLALVSALYRRRVRSIEQERLTLAEAVKAGRADLQAANQRLQELSLTDMLTGLGNRRYFSEIVQDEIRLLMRRFDERLASGDLNRDVVLFLLDLDRFKLVNDVLGHAAGDIVLKETARRLGALLRRTDRLVRWGGEEFLGISLDCSRGEAPELASRILTAISQEPYPVGPPEGTKLTVSIGWAAFPFSLDDTAAHPEDVIRLADRALYRSKGTGRNRATGISPSGDALAVGEQRGTTEILRDLGLSVTFTTVIGPPPRGGQDLTAVRETGAIKRPSF